MQSVEEKVGLHLHLQRLELRLCKLSSKSGGLQFPFTITSIIVRSMTHHENEPVNKQPTIEIPIKVIKGPKRGELAGTSHDVHVDDKVQHDKCAAQSHTQTSLKQNILAPGVAIN